MAVTEKQLQAVARRWRAKNDEATQAREILKAQAIAAIQGGMSERRVAEVIGVTRMTLRVWQGKRDN